MSQFELELGVSDVRVGADPKAGRLFTVLRGGWDRPMQSFWSDVKIDLYDVGEGGAPPPLELTVAEFYHPVGFMERESEGFAWAVSQADALLRASINRYVLLRAYIGARVEHVFTARLGGAHGPVYRVVPAKGSTESAGPLNLTSMERELLASPHLRYALPNIGQVMSPENDGRVRDLAGRAAETFAGPQTMEATSVYGEVR